VRKRRTRLPRRRSYAPSIRAPKPATLPPLGKLTLEHEQAELERLARQTVGGILEANPPLPDELRLKAAIAVLPRREQLKAEVAHGFPPGLVEALITGDRSKLGGPA
jgi:hypothetical protein